MTPTQLTTIITQYLIDFEGYADFNGDIDALSEGLARRICEQQTPQPERDTTTVQRLRWMANNTNLTDRQRATCREAADMIEREKCDDH